MLRLGVGPFDCDQGVGRRNSLDGPGSPAHAERRRQERPRIATTAAAAKGTTAMLEYNIKATRLDERGSLATYKEAQLLVDTGLEGRSDAFNPAELFLASIATCILKGIERVAPMLKFEFRDIELQLVATRQDAPPKIISVDYEIIVDTDESDQRLELLHTNVRRYGTIFNTVVDAAGLSGRLHRKGQPPERQ